MHRSQIAEFVQNVIGQLGPHWKGVITFRLDVEGNQVEFSVTVKGKSEGEGQPKKYSELPNAMSTTL